MAATDITLDQLTTDLHGRADRLRSPRGLMDVLKLTCVADLQGGIADGVDVDGVPFAPLAFDRPTGGGGLPLRDQGLLIASLAAGPNHVESVSETEIVVGTNRPGASLLNRGGVVEPVAAKWLCIPLTIEARRAGSPLNFPGKLRPRFGRVGGVMLDDSGTAHYAMTKRTVHPMRQFVGAGLRLLGKLRAVIADWWTDGGATTSPGGGP
jgi:hypothetical protein